MVRLPTRARDWRLTARTVRLVLTVPSYALLALVVAAFGLTLFVLSLSPGLFGFLAGGALPLGDRLAILLSLYPFVGTEFGPVAGGLLVGVSLLFGANVATLVYHLREHDLSAREGGASAVGLILGTLGAGCAACGTAILAGVLSLFGLPAALTFLPLEGLEFALLALVALALSTYWLADGMRGGEVNGCPVEL
ncbi:hypothetical protein ACFQPA_01480 [Halomarina halobia]|uniref:Uncharacterized protein n=1 Tax=Halomarina halobia TaxID=3033386 RepID=A0ABD6A6P6_9EURY|nr:hypothetical protein [Halomarina sp. PSR21]